MVNLTIRLSKGPGGASGGVGDGGSGLGGSGEGIVAGSLLDPAVTVSCPDHLVLADLPVAKALGSVSDVTLVKVLGRKARRRLGDKVHFCVRCDFPIAIYGRLDPCEHIFCLTCARKDSTCYLCGERVLRIQRLEVLDGIFICGAPRCLRSFIKRQDFQVHVKEAHADLIETAEDREKMRQDIEFQRGTVSSDLQVQTQALSRSSSGVQLPLQDLKSFEGQSSHGLLQKPTTPPSLEEKQMQKSDSQQSHGERYRRSRHERQQLEETRYEEQNAQQSEMQHAFQPLQQQQSIQPSLLPAPQPGIPIFSPPPFAAPYASMQQDGMNLQPMYPLYQMPPSGGHLLPSPPLPPPRPPSGVPPPPLMPPPPPKRGKYEPGLAPPGEPLVDPQNYVWSGGNLGNYGNFGGWPATQ